MSSRPASLWDILACPTCHGELARSRDELTCVACTRRYPIVDEVPILLPDGRAPLPRDEGLPDRHGYDAWIPRTVFESLARDAIVLELGAGNMTASHPNLIRLDVTLTPHVDVVGDAHALPFRTDVLDFVFSLAVLEHLRQPFVAAAEMTRILRPGGYLYAECAFVFPFHGHPHHYFNATHLGLAELFGTLTSVRAGVAPYQMPSYAVRALLETYRFFLAPHPDPAAQRVSTMMEAVLQEDLGALDSRFSQDAAQRCAACTFFFGVRTPEASEVIPASVLAAHRDDPELRRRYPEPFDLGAADNLMTWARGEGRSRADVATDLAGRTPFSKGVRRMAPPAAPSVPAAPSGSARERWLARVGRAGRRLTQAITDRGARAGWTVESIIDAGERVTHLFPNDCYVAHLSIYHHVLPLVAGATVLDAGSGSGYGAHYLAANGARLVRGIDGSPKAIAFSRHHFVRANLRYDVMRLDQLESLEPGAWDVIVCSNVLEHVPEVDAVLRAAWTLLRPGGTFLLAVPPIVNESLRAQNLANPHHVNIWTPRQWAHALERYFDRVQPLRHWYDKPGVELNLANSPADTVVAPGDFTFEPVALDALYTRPTITAVYAASERGAPERLPAAGSSPTFVDDSFTRPAPPAPEASWVARARSIARGLR